MRKYGKWAAAVCMTVVLAAAGCQPKEEGKSAIADLISGEPEHGGEIPEETEEIRAGYYYNQLAEEEKGIYRQLLQGIQEFQGEVEVASGDKDIIDRAYSALLCDRMELFWVKNASTYYTTLYDDYAVFEPNYERNREEAGEIQTQIEGKTDAVAEEIAAGGGSSYDMVKAVYEYIINTTQYLDSQDDQNIVSVFSE